MPAISWGKRGIGRVQIPLGSHGSHDITEVRCDRIASPSILPKDRTLAGCLESLGILAHRT